MIFTSLSNAFCKAYFECTLLLSPAFPLQLKISHNRDNHFSIFVHFLVFSPFLNLRLCEKEIISRVSLSLPLPLPTLTIRGEARI